MSSDNSSVANDFAAEATADWTDDFTSACFENDMHGRVWNVLLNKPFSRWQVPTDFPKMLDKLGHRSRRKETFRTELSSSSLRVENAFSNTGLDRTHLRGV